jgi:tetratricopeptide (TPR) repeat protein
VRALALERAAVGLLPKAPPGPTPRPGCPEPAYGKASRAVARALQNHDYLAAIRALERFRRKCGSYSRASSLLRKVRRLRARWLDEQVAEMTRSYERGDYDMAARIAGAILSKAAPDNSQAIALQSKVERCRQLWTAYRIRLQSAGYDRRIEGLERILALNPTDPQVREERERLLEIKRVEDTRPPKILAPKQVKTSHPDRVEIQVAVSDPTGIKEFTLYYRRTGVFKGRMKQASRDGEGLASVSKIIAIPGEVIKKKDLLVRVRAEDLAGNVAWYPGEGDEVKIQID